MYVFHILSFTNHIFFLKLYLFIRNSKYDIEAMFILLILIHVSTTTTMTLHLNSNNYYI